MKVFFVQCGFENQGGHYMLETRAWRRAVASAGLEWRGFGNARLDAKTAAEAEVVALFPFAAKGMIDPDPVSREITNLLYFSEHFANAAVLMTEVTANDLVIVEFADAALLYGCARWLRQLPVERRPYLAVIVHVPDDQWKVDGEKKNLSGPIASWRFAVNQLKVSAPPGRLCVSAIDHVLTRFLSNILQLEVKTTPLVSWFDPEVLAHPPDTSFDLLIAGGMRIDKGSDFVIATLQSLREDGQAHRVSLQADSQADAAILMGRLGTPGAMRIDVAIGPLPAPEYIERLNRSKVALLPYRAEQYAIRGSGIAAEAFGYGVPIVAPANTWMSERLSEGMGSGVTFDRFEPASIAAAARTALSQWPKLREAALANAARWRHNNSAEVALQKIRESLSL